MKTKDTIEMIAIRADIDGLLMPENNQKLPYKSQTKYAHMCGHDGHVAMLMAAVEVVMKKLDKIPSNKTVRLLWQPAEEGPGGALPMIADGCLEDVDEVYGLHNVPNYDEGDIRVVAGPIMAAAVIVKIKVRGKGGSGSAPHKVKDPISQVQRDFTTRFTRSSLAASVIALTASSQSVTSKLDRSQTSSQMKCSWKEPYALTTGQPRNESSKGSNAYATTPRKQWTAK